MTAVYKRELKSYFRSFIGMLFIAVTLFFVGMYFSVVNIRQGYPYFSYVISSVIVLFFISIPVLTMRILAEEKKNKTDQMILTAPVSVGGIVMGKFLALLTIFAIPTGVFCLYPLIMNHFGAIPFAQAYLAVLAFFLYGMTAIAVGILISSLTESQVISSVLTFLVLFLAYMMDTICQLISASGNWLTKLLGCLDMMTPFYSLLNGTLDLQAVAYFLSMTALALFLTVQSIQKRRCSVSVKSLSFGAYSTGMIALAAAVTAAFNIVIGELPYSWTSVDVTSQKLYSLTNQTKEFIKGIEEDVTIYVLSAEDSCDGVLRQTLQYYDDFSDHIAVEYIDPSINPRFYTQYTSGSISYNSLIIVSEKRNKIIDYNDLYESSYTYDYETGGCSNVVTGYDGEGQITSVLDYVLSDDMPKVYFTEGHGEISISSTFANGLKKENVDYETIRLMDYEEVPEDAACVFIHGAMSDFSGDDADKIIRYMDGGGNVVLVTVLTDEETPQLDRMLDYMGLEMAEGLIVEQDREHYYMNPYYLLPVQAFGAYTTGVYGSYYVFAPYAQGILLPEENVPDTIYTSILTTSDKAYAKTDVSGQLSVEKSEEDVDGPFPIAVEAAKELADGGQARMVVFGCAEFFTDEANSMVSGANLTVFTNTVSEFVDHEISVSIPAKSYEVSYLTIPQSKIMFIGVITTIFMPVGCLAAGFVIWFGRRKR